MHWFCNNSMYSVFSYTDLYFMDGMEAVFHITDVLGSIVKESRMYKGNAGQFLELRSSSEENIESNEPTNITISAKDLMILFGHSKDKDFPLEKVATANLEFDISAVLVGEKPERVDMDIEYWAWAWGSP